MIFFLLLNFKTKFNKFKQRRAKNNYLLSVIRSKCYHRNQQERCQYNYDCFPKDVQLREDSHFVYCLNLKLIQLLFHLQKYPLVILKLKIHNQFNNTINIKSNNFS